jgi:general secretion pathway protein E
MTGHRAISAALLPSQPSCSRRPDPMNAALNDPASSPDERVAALLLQRGKLKDADLVRARRLQEQDGGGLLALLGRLGLVSERDHAEACAAELDLPLRSARDVTELPPEDVALGIRFMKQFHVVPVGADAGHVDVLLADPQDPYVLDAVRLATGREPRPSVAVRSEIDELVERWHGQGRSAMDSIVENAEGEEGFDDVEHLRDLASEAPVIRLVNLVIQRAVELRASDIHIEPFENRLKVRYRIDGVLEEGESPPANLTAAIISRIKIMARLNIAERRLPQDGRIMLRVQGKELDLRVSSVPTAHGESVVMRLLDRETVVLDFSKLGFGPAVHAAFPEGPGAAARDPAGDRPDRLRQDHHPVHRAEQAQHARRQDHHRRGPGRIPDRGHQPDPGQAADRAGLRQRAAQHRPPGSGHHHDRRNARPGDRARSRSSPR